MPPSYFPLRWESTGDQWWYATPIDFAAANGHYDLVRELLHLDPNLLIKLTSLRRIRRLETVWDDEESFNDVAKCRSLVAKKLLLAGETPKGHNTLIRAGYGGWLLYTAASAGDLEFIKELLQRDPLLVFGEGEYGVTDILYAAARSKKSDVFRILLDFAFLGQNENTGESCFRQEMMNRAAHAAARGGNLEILMELIGDFDDEIGFRDAQGSTVLHSASARGQVEVVKALIESFNLVNSTDYQGNTALHIAAYRGHLSVVELLIRSSPSLITTTNNFGDTFLHMAVSGFRTPGFRRVDRQIELMKHLVTDRTVNLLEIINVTNKEGRTALHIAVLENIQSSLIELIMTIDSIDLNIRDTNGMTPLDLLKQNPKSASSEILIRQLISAGGISNPRARSAIANQLRGHGIGTSPGTSFQISDAEIFLYTGFDNVSETSVDYSSGLSEMTESNGNKSKFASVRRLKAMLQWARKREKKPELDDDGSVGSFTLDRPVPLRHKYSKEASFSTHRRVSSFVEELPSPLARRNFNKELTQGVIRVIPQLGSPCDKRGDKFGGNSGSGGKQGLFSRKVNQYLVENPSKKIERSTSLVA